MRFNFKTKRGLRIPLSGAPEQRLRDGNEVRSVGLVAADYRGLKPALLVREGERVRLGQPLLRDKIFSDRVLTSPGCGEVSAVHLGPRRALQSLVIRLDGDEEESFEPVARSGLSSLDPKAVRDRLLASGLWASLRTRPFSQVPEPASVPHAIFVTAMDSNPLAADPRVVIETCPQDFADGVSVLSRLTEGEVYVCQAPGADLPLPDIDGVSSAVFAGPHPAGLPGTHIHFLEPVSELKSVWHLHYQDVIAIGRLFTSGRLSVERVISLAGPLVRRPGLLRARVGASTADLLEGELEDTECRVISGSILGGRRAAGWARYLGPFHLQISVLPQTRERELVGWLRPGWKKYSAIAAFASALRPRTQYPLNTSQHGSPRAMVPIGNFERVMPLDILPAPLLKALLVRDTESARALGCLELDEEDLALCSFVCPSKYDYGPVLRENLERIEREG